MPTPTIGRIVHYHLAEDVKFPAIINSISSPEGVVCLSVFTPASVEHQQEVPHSPTPLPGHWSWPTTA